MLEVPAGPLLPSKILWTVDVRTPDAARKLVGNVTQAGVDGVCIRSTTRRLVELIPLFHRLGVRVYAWRWPAVVPSDGPFRHYYAPEEADYVADVLVPAGLDGYIVNPESDNAGEDNDWNRPGLAPLASAFCARIRSEADRSGRPFMLGTTSGCAYPKLRTDIPWAAFAAASDVLVPQVYWRRLMDDGTPLDINGGTPETALERGLDAWTPLACGPVRMAPMAGELEVASPGEIAAFGVAARAHGFPLHFYSRALDLDPAVLAAIRAI